MTAVEIQPELAELAARNADENGVRDRLRVLAGDLRRMELPRVDAVAFNPPYFKAGEGRAPPEAGRAVGRYESHGTLADFIRAAVGSTIDGGRLSAIVPFARGREVMALCAAHGASVSRRREVCSRAGSRPRHLLWEAVRTHEARLTPPVDEPPLVVHGDAGRAFSPEVRALLRE